MNGKIQIEKLLAKYKLKWYLVNKDAITEKTKVYRQNYTEEQKENNRQSAKKFREKNRE